MDSCKENKEKVNHVDRERSGVYHNDYSPRYKPAYDIYEKAREHMRQLRKR